MFITDSLQLHGLYPARFLCPWNSPGKNTDVGCLSFLQGIFPTQVLNLGLLHCRQILYHLSHQGSLITVLFIWKLTSKNIVLSKWINNGTSRQQDIIQCKKKKKPMSYQAMKRHGGILKAYYLVNKKPIWKTYLHTIQFQLRYSGKGNENSIYDTIIIGTCHYLSKSIEYTTLRVNSKVKCGFWITTDSSVVTNVPLWWGYQ